MLSIIVGYKTIICDISHIPLLVRLTRMIDFLLTDKNDTLHGMSTTVKTRFAPSPTGFMHVGNLRSGLFAWLIARNAGGEFHLRLEDTDKAREVEGSAEHIQETLKWLGLNVDGPVTKQSDRLAIYKDYAQKLIDKGLAYADPYTTAEIDVFREQAKQEKRPFLYRHHRPQDPPRWDGSQPLRLKTPEIKAYHWHDEVWGDMSAGPEALDDFILIKSDGYPTYNFAHIVDDYEMGFTHIVRGEEYLASVPRYLSLYESLEIAPPIFVTLPHILGKDGNKKMSKREGAKDALAYRDDGVLPAAFINFLASMGWNDGTDQEIFSIDEIIKKFSLARIQKSGARFDEDRLTWMNGQHIRKLSVEELNAQIADSFWPPSADNHDTTYKLLVLGAVQERLKYFSELPILTSFFFETPSINKNDLLEGIEPMRARTLLQTSLNSLVECSFEPSDIEHVLQDLLTKLDSKPGELFKLLRNAVTGAKFTPPIQETIAVLGRNRVESRLKYALELLA